MDASAEGPDAKRRATAPTAPSTAAPQVWPSQAALLGQGLECKAEALTPTDGSWVVDGAKWRQSSFASEDANSDVLRQRQKEMRRMMLHRPGAE